MQVSSGICFKQPEEDGIDYTISWANEDTLFVAFKQSPQKSSLVPHAVRQIGQFYKDAPNVIQIVPSYQSVLVQFDLLDSDLRKIEADLISFLQALESTSSNNELLGRQHIIPVYYSPDVAAGLDVLLKEKNLSLNELINYHCRQFYDVYALGFLPGFAYLGFVPDQIAMPRHQQFKGSVPQGSVAIADQQTAIYPFESPGGWNVIGRTPIKVYQSQKSLLGVGDTVQFKAIDKQEYLQLGGEL